MSTKTSHRRSFAKNCKLEKKLTEQSHKHKCDIKRIVKSAMATGAIDHLNSRAAQAGDLSSIPDFKQAMDRIAEAKSTFHALPAALRKKFHNDPRNFVDFVSNPANLPEMRALGLAAPEPKPTPDPVPVRVEVVNQSDSSGKA